MRTAPAAPPWPQPPPSPLAALAGWARLHPLSAAAQALERPWAVAYSGGADSSALLLAAHQLWPGRVQALHIHHGLQDAAAAFVAHAQQQCAHLGLPLHWLQVQAQPAPGQSPQDAARRARYRALAAMAQQHGAAWVLLAQHAQDQLETVLLALTRGAGLPGLAAMPAAFERHGCAFGRPLLDSDARALRAWLQAQGTSWIEDPSNADGAYVRNRIRLQVLPALLDAFPASLHTFARSAAQAAQAQGLLSELAAQDLQHSGDPPALAALRSLSPERQANLLRHWLRSRHATQASAAQLHELQRQITACRTRAQGIELKLGHGRVQRRGDWLVYEPGRG